MLSMVFVMIIMARASAERVCEVLSEESTLKNPDNPVCEVKNGDIQFEDVVFTYNRKADKPVLNHINLNIRSGQTIGIIGGTGSSKSSLVQLIPRLYDVTEGRVLVGDVDVRDYDIESLRNEVAMVLQKNVIFSGTIKENLRWGDKNATDEEIQRVCVWPVRTNLSRLFRRAMIRILSRAVRMYPVVRNSDFVLQEHF